MGILKVIIWILAFATCVLAGLLNKVFDEKKASHWVGAIAVVLCAVNAYFVLRDEWQEKQARRRTDTTDQNSN